MSVRKALRKLLQWERYHGRYDRLVNSDGNPVTAPSKGWHKAALRYVTKVNPAALVEVDRPE